MAGILIFAILLFLLLAGIVSLVKRTCRLIAGRPNPAKSQTVILVLERGGRMEDEGREADEEIIQFALFLHSKLTANKAGRYSGIAIGDGESQLRFDGPYGTQIWGILEDYVKDCSPAKPLSVTIKPNRKKSGWQIIAMVPWHPVRKADFQNPSENEIPEKWLRLSGLARRLAMSGFVGILGWRILQYSSGETENGFRQTQLGELLAWLVGGVLVSGLSLSLICSLRMRSMTRHWDYISWETPLENTLKYVLLIVIAIFGLISFLI